MEDNSEEQKYLYKSQFRMKPNHNNKLINRSLLICTNDLEFVIHSAQKNLDSIKNEVKCANLSKRSNTN